MDSPREQFAQRISRLKADLAEQGRRVLQMVEQAVEAVFSHDLDAAKRIVKMDAVIDKVDVDIERAAVKIVNEMCEQVVESDPDTVRWLFTIVKVNNELERIADLAVDISERVGVFVELDECPPERFRVMANSVIGIVENAAMCFERADIKLAEIVLASDDLVDEFESAILREMHEELAEGAVAIDFAFAVNGMAAAMERIDDHCTNIAEQIIYVATGKIVRHAEGHWTSPENPA